MHFLVRLRGIFGSEGNDLDDLPIGLQTQVALFKADLILAKRFNPRAEKTRHPSSVRAATTCLKPW